MSFIIRLSMITIHNRDENMNVSISRTNEINKEFDGVDVYDDERMSFLDSDDIAISNPSSSTNESSVIVRMLQDTIRHVKNLEVKTAHQTKLLTAKASFLRSSSLSNCDTNESSSSLTTDDPLTSVLTRFFLVLDTNRDGLLNKGQASFLTSYIKDSEEELTGIDIDCYLNAFTPLLKGAGNEINLEELITLSKQALQTYNKNQSKGHYWSKLSASLSQAKHHVLFGNEIGNDDLIHPHSTLNLYWHGIIGLLFLSLFISMPFVVAWPNLTRRLFPLHMFIDILLMCDIVKTFHTGAYVLNVEEERVIMDRNHIRKHYLKRDIILDIIVAFPIDFVIRVLDLDTSSGSGRALNIARFVKLLRITRVFSLTPMIEDITHRIEWKFAFNISDGIVKLVHLLAYVAVWAHISGCIQFMIVQSKDFPLDSWISRANLTDASISDQWKWSYFKAMSQVLLIGFESPPIVTTACVTMSDWCQLEMWTTLLFGLFPGAVFFSLLIAAITRIAETYNLKSRRFEERFNNLQGFLEREKLPSFERDQILSDFSRRHARDYYFDEEEALTCMGPHRVDIILWHRAKQLARISDLFSDSKNCDFLRAIASVMERVTFDAFEDVFDVERHGEHVYFLLSGIVDLIIEESSDNNNKCKINVFATVYVGESFGYEALYYQSFAIARTRAESHFFRIHHEKWQDLMSYFPDLERVFEQISDERYGHYYSIEP